MTGKTTVSRLTVAAYMLAAVLMAAGFGGVIDSQPILTRAELVGTWAGPDGATMTFREDHTVTVRHLVGIGFYAQPIEACSSEFTSSDIKRPVGLCLYLDPDSPCTGSVLTN